MTLNLTMPEHEELKPRITVFGVGGAGGNAVNNMIDKELEGVEFVVANTDAQALQQSKAASRVQLGVKATEGLGAGARPSIGAAAAEESIEQIIDHLAGSHMCFITAGMGGGTGTGAAPIIAQAARELGVLTVGVVTKPFQFEGSKRMRQAEEGVENLQKMVDTLIIIPNQNLFRLANDKTTFTEAFSMADDVLYQGVKGVTDLMVRPGLINLDFADVRAVMDEMGKAMMGTGEAEGEDRAIQAAEKAIANPLLDEISLKGAKGVLINITGGYDLTLFELDEAANKIREQVDEDANIIVGSTLDPDMKSVMRVSVVATGIDASERTGEMPVPRRKMATPLSNEPETAEREVPSPAIVEQERQPMLFDSVRETEVTQEVAAEPADDLPAPAYAPAAQESFDPVRYEHTEEPAASAAPEPAVAVSRERSVSPSAETLARLHEAVRNNPAASTRGREDLRRYEARPGLGAEPVENVDRPRFGINSLINRMTGHQEEPRPQRAAPRVSRQEEPQQARAVRHEEIEEPRSSDQIEIPAFLRRQAN